MEGQLKTLNKRGFDMGKPSHRFDDWLSCYVGDLPLLDVGCGLGTNALEALRRGARVIAMDCSDEHLGVLREAAGSEAVRTGQLRTVFGCLPDSAKLEPASVAGILCAQVLHFLEPEGVKKTFDLFYRWLAPGGKLVLLVCSHYCAFNLRTGRIREIQTQIEKEGADNHDSWPGYYERGQTNTLMEEWRDACPPEVLDALPEDEGPTFLTFTERQLAAVARHAGFNVQEADLVSGHLSNVPRWVACDPSELDDEELRPLASKDMVMLIATKPQGP